jgi:hypothetical protein
VERTIIKLEITRILKKVGDEGTSFEFALALSEEQTSFLVQFAIGQLVQAGLAVYNDVDENGDSVASNDEDAKEQDDGLMECHLNSKVLN